MTGAERDTKRIQREYLDEQRTAALTRHLNAANHKIAKVTCPVCVGIVADRPFWIGGGNGR